METKMIMVGQVWDYNKATNSGSIIGRDQQRYNFSREDYFGKMKLEEGNIVDFKAEGKRAREIKLLIVDI